MEDKKYKTVIAAGTLIIPGCEDAYYLLLPHPVEKEQWMSDDMAVFYVANSSRKPHNVAIQGPFVIDYWSEGKEIQVLDEEESVNISKLFESARVAVNN